MYIDLVNQHKTYIKALRVIDSCQNAIHCKGARNYVNQFFKTFASLERGGIFQIEEMESNMYADLMLELSKKEALLRV
tara:strand:+ start:1042 stop:1275 length:234 start_codon:yes stop_codon:yes gene_type:complete